jgi:DNA-binding transcriptional LysR family regulator
MSNWEGVTEFVAVAESTSFTTAARKLSTSVAQVSRRVAQLEQRLAVKLLHRTTRKVTLTEAGQLYFDTCKQLVEGLDHAERLVTQMQVSPKGLIKVTAPVTYGETHIAPLMNQFLNDYPAVELELHLTNQKLDLIEDNIDVAIRLGRLADSTLRAKRLADRQLYVCASPAYIDKHGFPLALSDLTQHQCLIGSNDYWRFHEKNTPKTLKVNGRIKCNSGVALRSAAMSGLGLVQLPDYYVEHDLESGSLVEVLREFRDKKEGVWALYPENRHLSPKVRSLIDFLAEHLGHSAIASKSS